MSNTDFNDSASEYFLFRIGGYDYKMKYPTMQELSAIRDRILKAQESNDDKAMNDAISKEVNSLVTPVKEETPKIEDVIEKQPVNVIRSFNDRMQKELEV